mgnify:CR=1 FL=1
MNRFISISFLSVIALAFVALGTTIACGSDDSDEAADSESSGPAWFALDGDLHMLSGEAHSIGLQMRVYGEDPSAGVLEGCEVVLAADTLTAQDTTPDPMITHWWSMNDLMAVSWGCLEQAQLPTSATIGLGEFHPELNGRVLSLELSDPSAFLYGFYASLSFDEPIDGFNSESTYIVGYGSTESTLSGVEEVSLDGTLPDGLYQLDGVFLLPLAP